MPSRSLTIKLFGPLHILVQDESLPRLRPRSVEWMLALLILRQGRPVERSWLAGTLWPDSDEGQALHNLRNGLLVLRRALGSEGARLQSPARSTLFFDLNGADVDVLRFDRAIRVQETDSLREAVALYTGPLMEGCDEVWITAERTRREQDCLTALETLAQRAEEQGAHAEAIRYLWQAQNLDPLREPSVRQLMALLAESGDAAGAIEVYREFRNRLHTELNASPDAETLSLFQQIRERGKRVVAERRPVLAVQKPTASESAVTEKEGETHSVTVSTEPASPVSSLRVMARIPHALAPLIGRTEELETLLDSLHQNRLVTLVGTGGVGKTRLAMAVAEKVKARFAGGTAWVELAPLSEKALILPTLAEASGLAQDVRSDSERLHSALVSHFSQGESLLVLDNCEHLLDAVAEVVQRFLLLCPMLRVLATSRQRMGVKGEVIWRVPSLSAPRTEELPAEAAEASASALNYPAVRLFVERAEAARVGFSLKRREEVEAVCHICRRLDGIPLALELAAARANVLSVEQIAKRLDNRFRLLTEGSRSDPPRHQTLRALIDWSYDQLSEAEQKLLRRLSVFVGGWSLEAAEAVFEASGVPMQPTEDALDVLSALVNRSLVLTDEHWDGLRYRMLETVREYALDRLRERGTESIARERHADFCLALAETAWPFLAKPELEWLKRLDTEHDNLRGALTFFIAQEGTQEKAVRLTAALAKYWSLRAHAYEERNFLVMLARRSTPLTKARVDMLDYAALFLGTHDDPFGAEQLFREMLASARTLNYASGIAQALNGLAWLLSSPSLIESGYDFVAVRALSEESLSITRELGDKQSVAHCLFRLGCIARQQGEFETARVYLTECRSFDQELGVKGGLAMLQLGEVALETGDYEEAKRCILPFLVARQEIGERWGVVYGLFGLGKAALAEGEWERAACLLGASFAVKETLSNPFEGYERTVYDPLRQILQKALGEEASVRLWEEGAVMTLEQMISYAISWAFLPIVPERITFP